MLANFKGESLRRYFQQNQLTIKAFLEIATLITGYLISQNKQTTRYFFDPDRIIVKRKKEKFDVQLFSLDEILPDQLLSDAYLSPEETGKVKQDRDARSDLYKLGMLLYEMLAGELPFSARNTVEWAHTHVAVAPKPLSSVRPDIPKMLDAIVMNLLEKNPDHRYQHVYGLHIDLQRCLSEWHANQSIQSFDLNRTLVIGRFDIPDKLYDRDIELAMFEEILKQAVFGSTELIVLTGPSGIGKTTLVKQAFEPLAKEAGYFTSGKFDQLEKHLPYESFIQAFRGLLRQILTQPEQKVDQWKEKIIRSLGSDGAVITEVIPELEVIIGKQKPVETLPAVESERRFKRAFRRFVQVFRNIDEPLVLFLDDMQWADRSSILLMESLLRDPDGQGLVVIAADRHQDIEKHHPILQKMHGLKEVGVGVHHMPLQHLPMAQVHQLIVDTLSCRAEECKELVPLLFQKTAGEPFYLKQVLQLIHHEGWLIFSEREHKWQWQEQKIRGMQGQEHIVQYMEHKIKQLSEGTRDVLSLAACFGNQFSSEHLSKILEESAETIRDALAEAIMASLLIPLQVDERSGNYQFFHDRIQQTVYSLLSDKRKKEGHLAVGRYMSAHVSPANEVDFEMVDHLNKGKSLISDPREIEQLVHLNDEAGRKAKRSGAFELARQYFRTGAEALRKDQWDTAFDFCFNLYLEWSECEYLCGHHEQAETLYDMLIGQARTWTERAKVYCKQVIQCAHQGKYSEAISRGAAGLAEAGIRIPNEPKPMTVMTDVWRTNRRIPPSPDRLKSLPEVRDRKMKMVMELMFHMIEPSFFLNKSVFAVVVLKFMRLILKHGRTPVASAVFSAYGVLLISELKAYKNGYEIGKVAVELADASGMPSVQCRTYVMFGAVCCQWVHHGKEGIPYLDKAVEMGLSSGDYVYTSMAMSSHMESIYTSASLSHIEKVSQRYLDTLEQINRNAVAKNAAVFIQFSRCLKGFTKNRFTLSDAYFDEEAFLRELQDDESERYKLFRHYTYKLQIYFFYGAYEKAVAIAKRAVPYLHLVGHLTHLGEYYFYVTLAMTCGLGDRERREQREWMKEIKKNLIRFQRWAVNSPENFAHKESLIRAELHRLQGKEQTAAGLYDEAVFSANEQGFFRNGAIANELAGRFYLSLGREKVSKVYLSDAYQGYRSWGAKVKADELEKQYLLFSDQALQDQNVDTSESEVKPSNQTASSKGSEDRSFNFDLATIMKVSQSLSREMDLHKVLRQLMWMMVQNAGAQKGVLLLERSGELFVEAVVEEKDTLSIDSLSLNESRSLSHGIARYVARTKEPVLLDNACGQGAFTTDDYVKENQCQSILCLPLMTQGKWNGLLYLENQWITGLFRLEEIEVLQTLASQAMFVKKLLSSSGGMEGEPRSSRHQSLKIQTSKEEGNPVLLESLTERELDILNSMAAGMTNQEIATKFGLKVATVKVHNRNIFSKLNVNRRMKAVAQAKELNLIKS